ncbi:MAG: triose-phosphate isomerase [Candidatus Izemoplasmatales bacterium]|jgi:triosephosphate isomerase
MRKPIIAGNWKMFKTRDEALFFILKVFPLVPSIDKVDTVLCAQAPLLHCLVKRQGDNLRIGSQNLHYEDEGAYTGEVSGKLLKSCKVEYVIIGHSERRQYFKETDEIVNLKLKAALRNDLKPIVCVGEHLDEREKNLTEEVLKRQIRAAFKDIDTQYAQLVTIAYEPIWAIGTGRTATSEIAEEACAYIRSLIREMYDAATSEKVRIQYGGSVKPGNIAELLAMPDIDGALIGGASLDPEAFVMMATAAIRD